MIPGLFCDFIRLAGEKRFIDLNLSVQNHRVGADLIAGGEDYNIIQNKLFRGNYLHPAVPHRPGFGGVQDRQLFQSLFGVHLLNDTDQGVGNNDRQKGEIPKRTDDNQQNRDEGKDQVEIRKNVGLDDFRGGLGGGFHGTVVPAVLSVFFYLGSGQACVYVCLIPCSGASFM